MIQQDIEKVLSIILQTRLLLMPQHRIPFTALSVTDLPSSIRDFASLSEPYITDGSVGAGNWARIPWLAVFDSRVTNTARTGYT